MSEMIERVAKAIHKVTHDDKWPTCNFCKDAARAAIEAMRQPTEAMIGAGRDATINNDPLAYPDVEDTWPAMIDAALKDD